MSGSIEKPKLGNNSLKTGKGPDENKNSLLKLNRDEAINSVKENNKNVKESILERQEIVEVRFENKEGKFDGQIVVDRELVSDIKKFFAYVESINDSVNDESEKFYIELVRPVSSFGWSDQKSGGNNNTSGFNYRHIKGDPTRPLSLHSFGFAIDINPKENPCFYLDNTREPVGGADKPIFNKNHKIVKYLVDELGFEWGGSWSDPVDNHHFEKIIPTEDYINNYIEVVKINPDIKKESIIKRVSGMINNSSKEEHFDIMLKLVNNEFIVQVIGFAEVNGFKQKIKEERINKMNDENLRS
jgi:peptidoglycan L-alanyl-D-glutamate endopeptidase CwlK